MSTGGRSPIDVGASDEAGFVDRFGGVIEYSPWVAQQAWASAPFRDLAALHAAFEAALLAAPPADQLAVLRAHPDLAIREAKAAELTPESASEQAGAGLDRMGREERLALADALAAYRDRFGFPFIVCVRDHGGAGLDELVATRIHASAHEEFAVALAEVSAIARYRLADLIAEESR
jgi:OHCU decarboxylase